MCTSQPLLTGVFTETLYNDNFTIHHRTYAHRSISHLFVVEIDLTLHVSPSTINNIKLKFPRFSMTTDMTFHQLKTNLSKEVRYGAPPREWIICLCIRSLDFTSKINVCNFIYIYIYRGKKSLVLVPGTS